MKKSILAGALLLAFAAGMTSCSKTPALAPNITKQELYDGASVTITPGTFNSTTNSFTKTDTETTLYINGLNDFTDKNGVKLASVPVLNWKVGKSYQVQINFAENNESVNNEYYNAWDIHQFFFIPGTVTATATQKTDDGDPVYGITQITPINGVLDYKYTDVLPAGIPLNGHTDAEFKNPRIGLSGVFTVLKAQSQFDLAVTLRHGIAKFTGKAQDNTMHPEQANAPWNDPNGITYANNDFSTTFKIMTSN